MRIRKRRRRKTKLKKVKKFKRGRGLSFLDHLKNAFGMTGVRSY